MKLECFKSSLLIAIVSTLFVGCPTIQSLEQPDLVATNSSFTSTITVTLDSTLIENVVPNFAVKLPIGWTVIDSVPFDGSVNGFFVFDSIITDSVNVLWPCDPDEYWWGARAADTTDYIYADTVHVTPSMISGTQFGFHELTYRVGDDKLRAGGMGGEIPGFLNMVVSETMFVTPDPSPLDGEVYISPTGDWGTDGSESAPLKTVREALARISADSLNSATIHLADGTYSPSTNGEMFPLELTSYMTIAGQSQDQVILDAEGSSRVMSVVNAPHCFISNMTITGGLIFQGSGGGIYVAFSDPEISSVSITDNSARYGAGIYCDSSDVLLSGVSITENVQTGAEYIGAAGMYSVRSNPILQDVTISDNSGIGIYLERSSAVLQNVDILQNTMTGLWCAESHPTIIDVSITGNSGIGIRLEDSSPSLQNVNIMNNADGGLRCIESGPTLNTVRISRNSAFTGAGMHCTASQPILENVTISHNIATGFGGGIYSYQNSSITFSGEERSNIYYNVSLNQRIGSDIFTTSPIEVIVDTFTVLQPNEYHASPLAYFTFDVLNFVYEQIDADFYVSPSGDDANDGMTPETPLKTIMHAGERILGTSEQPRTIFLADGVYSPSSTGEFFPVYLRAHISLVGESELGVVLDGELSSNVISIGDMNDEQVSNMTITGGQGQGILCQNSSPRLKNLTIHDNSGTGILCESSNPQMEHLNIHDNSASGLIIRDQSRPEIKHVTISANQWVGIGITNGSSVRMDSLDINENISSGIFCSWSELILTNASILNNGADGIALNASPNSLLDRVIIAGNADHGVSCAESNPILTSITIADNGRYGLRIAGSAHPMLTNSIAWNNSNGTISFLGVGDPGSLLVAHSALEGGSLGGIFDGGYYTIDWSEGNTNIDPLFVDQENGDYSLQEGSPCINTGTSFFVWAGDTIVNIPDSTYQGGEVDMGCFESPYSTVSISLEHQLPLKFSLDQNYPNPFNPSTTIRYELPHQSDVQIIVYDVLGQIVATLVSENQAAGYGSVQWDGKDKLGHQVSTGMFLYVIHAGEFTQTRKMLLLK